MEGSYLTLLQTQVNAVMSMLQQDSSASGGGCDSGSGQETVPEVEAIHQRFLRLMQGLPDTWRQHRQGLGSGSAPGQGLGGKGMDEMNGVEMGMMGERETAHEERKEHEERREEDLGKEPGAWFQAGAGGYDNRLGLGPGVEEEEGGEGNLYYLANMSTHINFSHPHHTNHHTTTNSTSTSTTNLSSTLHHQPKQPPPVPSSDLDAQLIPQQQGTSGAPHHIHIHIHAYIPPPPPHTHILTYRHTPTHINTNTHSRFHRAYDCNT